MNYSKLLFVLFTSLLLNLGCSKTSKPETEHTILNNLKNKHITETPMTGVEAGIHFLSEFQSECDFRPELACGSILHFNSWQEYYDCYNCLDHEFNDWCDNFENHFSNLNEDDYNNLIETSDWSEDVPLMAYENTIDGFFSLRKKISLQMNTWEEVEPQDLNNCPEDFAFHDDIQRTLLNSEGNIAIGDRIYHYSSSGEILELPFDCDCVQQLLKTHTTPDCARVKRGTPGPPSCNGDYYLPQTSNYEFDDHTYRHDYYIQWHGGLGRG